MRSWDTDFNPLPRKEGDSFKIRWRIATEHFNPLPRKEGDVSQLYKMLR